MKKKLEKRENKVESIMIPVIRQHCNAILLLYTNQYKSAMEKASLKQMVHGKWAKFIKGLKMIYIISSF